MITNPEILKKLEDDLIKNEAVIPHDRSLDLLASMWEEGMALGVLPLKEPMECIDIDIRIAQVLNSCLTEFFPG